MSEPNSSPSPVASRGVIYVAFGGVFVAKALYSAETVKLYNPELGICIVSNIEFPGKEALTFWNVSLDRWVHVDDTANNNRRYKTGIAAHSPFEKSLYIDCDTFVTGSLSLAWLFLDYFDICFRFQEGKQKHGHLAKYEILPGVATPYLPHWSGGVVIFNNNGKVKSFFQAWQRNFLDSGLAFDQPSLVKTLFESDVRFLSLDTRWNGGFRPLDRDDNSVPLIIHYHSMYDAIIEERLKRYHRALEGCEGVQSGEIAWHLSERNAMRIRKGPARFFLRRIYRRWWYKKYLNQSAI